MPESFNLVHVFDNKFIESSELVLLTLNTQHTPATVLCTALKRTLHAVTLQSQSQSQSTLLTNHIFTGLNIKVYSTHTRGSHLAHLTFVHLLSSNYQHCTMRRPLKPHNLQDTEKNTYYNTNLSRLCFINITETSTLIRMIWLPKYASIDISTWPGAVGLELCIICIRAHISPTI